MVKIEKFEIKEKSYDSKEMEELKELIIKNTNIKSKEEINDLLPKSRNYIISFDLIDSFTGFANGIRRILVEELDVICVTCDDKDIVTNDEFILSDRIIKNLNLLALNQDINNHDVTFKLEKINRTNKIIDVNVSDLVPITKNNTNISYYYPDNNISIARLRPNKKIAISNIHIIKGKSKNDAGCFSLLSNIVYEPFGIEPYNITTGQGSRSINSNYTKFHFRLTTCGNILPKTIFNLLFNELFIRLNNCLNMLEMYLNNKSDVNSVLEVIRGDENEYRFSGEYLTMSKMLSQKCHNLDPSSLFVTGSINRYDDEIAVIRIKHPDSDKLLRDSIIDCIDDAKKIELQINKLIS